MTDDYATKYPCVKCSYCCRRGACCFGEWSKEKEACKHLTADNLCGIYEQIKQVPGSEWSPAFGAGCSSPLCNEMREAKLRGQA